MLLDMLGVFAKFGTNLRNERRLEGSASDASEEPGAPSESRLDVYQHQGRGSVGQLVAPHTKRAANPSPTNVAPTSTPFTRSVPQRRPKLHASVPSVPGAQEHAICWKSERPLLTSSLSRRLADSPFRRSASHRARCPVSGALKPTRRTFARPSFKLMVSPAMTCTEIEVGAWTTDLVGMVALGSPESFDET